MNSPKSFRIKLFLLIALQYCFVVNATPIDLSKEEKQWINQHPIIKTAGGPDWAPFDFSIKDKNSNLVHQGISQDILDIISAKTGLVFDVIINNWSDQLIKIKSTELDLLPILNKTQKREKYLYFSDSYFEALDYFFIRSNLNIDSIKDLNNFKIAIPKNYSYESFFKENYPDIEIITTQTITEAIIAVLEGKADMLYDSYTSLAFTIQKLGITSIIPFKASKISSINKLHMATTKSNQTLIGIINKALASITPKQKYDIFAKWNASSKNEQSIIAFTPEEISWINEHPSISIGGDKEWPPFEYLDENGKYTGIAADFIKKIEQKSGLKINVEVGKWDDIYTAFKEDKLSGLAGLVQIPSREADFFFTDPYITVPLAVIEKSSTKNTTKIEQLNDKTIALTQGSYIQNWLEKNHPEAKILITQSSEESLNAVAYGQADVYIGNIAVYDFLIKKNLISNLEITMRVPNFSTTVGFGISKKKPVLFSIINKSMQSISDQEKREIRDFWYKSDFKNTSLTKLEVSFFKNNPVLTYFSKPNWFPYEDSSKTGEHQGINADFLSTVATHLDVTFNIEEKIDLKNKNITHIFSGDIESEYQHSNFLVTKPYLTVPIVIIMKENNGFVGGLNAIQHFKISFPSNYSFSKKLIKKYPLIRTKSFDDPKSAIKELFNNDKQAVLLPLPEAKYYLRLYDNNKIAIVGKTEFNLNIGFLINKNFPLLYSAINKYITSMSESKKSELINSQFKVKFAKQTDYKLLFWSSFALLALSLSIFLWAKTLTKEIKRRKEIQAELKQERATFRRLIESSPDGIMVAIDKQLVDCNKAAINMLGFENKNQIIHSDLIDLLGTKQPNGQSSVEIIKKSIHECLTKGYSRYEVLAKNTNNNTFWVDVIQTPIKYKGEDGIYIIWRNITKQVRMKQDLIKANKMAQKANNAKSEFLANMSHEIRTPMNAIMGFTELLSEQVDDPKHKSFLNTIQSAGKSLLTLINDILDLSKIEAGKFSINKEAVNPYDFFKEICKIFSVSVKKKDLNFSVFIDENFPSSILIDPLYIRQILFNLLGNAVKFTEHGQITFRAKVGHIDEHLSKFNMLLEVEDTGIGIAEHQTQSIFKVFEQHEGQDKNKYQGTGLGLAISKKLIENLNGTISVTSELGKGSCFTVNIENIDIASIQAIKNDNKLIHDFKNIAFKPATILIVDDVEYNRELIKQIFLDSKINVIEAENGQVAISQVVKTSVDLIIMDIRMPIMDGYEASAIVKGKYSHIPIIALTASTLESNENYDNTLFDAFIRKPVNKYDLLENISHFLAFDEHDNKNQQEVVVEEIHDDEKIKNLINELNNKAHTLWEKANLSNHFNDIKAFSKVITDLSTQFNIKELASYSQELNKNIEIFDIASLKTSLSSFPNLLNILKELNS